MGTEETSKPKKHFTKKWWFWLIVIVVISKVFSSGENKNAPASASDNSVAPVATTPLPPEEMAFIQITQSAQKKSGEAVNDMQKGGVKAEREKEICKIIKGPVKDWVGQLVTIDANSEGRGVVGIEIAEKIKVLTWNNDLSDTNYGTLLKPDSEIFKKVSAMKVGQTVKFSGDFFTSDEEGECLKEGSMTLDGKIADPEYVFKFKKIEAI